MAVDDELASLAERLQARCIAAGLTCATAESCTGGLVAHAITSIAGSSAYFRGAIVAYEDEVKERLLGVPVDVLAAHGAVSAQVARLMATGARDRIGVDLAVGVTGIAGPSGATPGKPVGLTYLASAGAGGIEVRRETWTGDRAANIRASAIAALGLLLAGAESAR
ncbi:MAG TPA: CinA family protein [Candidatus Limnocylindrales bacterium]